MVPPIKRYTPGKRYLAVRSVPVIGDTCFENDIKAYKELSDSCSNLILLAFRIKRCALCTIPCHLAVPPDSSEDLQLQFYALNVMAFSIFLFHLLSLNATHEVRSKRYHV